MCGANQLGEKNVLFPDRQQQSIKEEKKKLRSAEFRFACFLGQMMRTNEKEILGLRRFRVTFKKSKQSNFLCNHQV